MEKIKYFATATIVISAYLNTFTVQAGGFLSDVLKDAGIFNEDQRNVETN